MARPIQFDREDVLNKALGLFWSDGYEASSISRLLSVMGLNRGSLYSSFSDKRTFVKVDTRMLHRFEINESSFFGEVYHVIFFKNYDRRQTKEDHNGNMG